MQASFLEFPITRQSTPDAIEKKRTAEQSLSNSSAAKSKMVSYPLSELRLSKINMVPWIILIVLLAFSSIGEGAQPAFDTSLTGVRRATSVGEATKALRYFETQAAKFEESARSEEAPRALLAAASQAYRLEAREIFGMTLNASLVVLSGCETGLRRLSNGDEFVGLTRAFIYAGTPSVVASLWKVDDASTANLMSSFYKHLKTISKMEALRQAQLEMMRGEVSSELLAQRGVGGIGKLGETASSMLPAPSSETSAPVVSTSHPYFWALFILVGDGR